MASGIYTNDSDIAMAAVHAGLLQPGQTGVIRIINVGSNNNFIGSTRNGVTTQSWSSPFCGIQLELVSIDTTPPPVTTSPPEAGLITFAGEDVNEFDNTRMKYF